MNVDYARMCYIFRSAIQKSLKYMPKIPETTIARYLLQWSLLEGKEIFIQGLPKQSDKPAPHDWNPAELEELMAEMECNYRDFESLIDYDYFDNPFEDLSGIDLTGFFPDDKPRKFQYRYGPWEKE